MVFNPYPGRDVHMGELEGPLDELLKCTGFQVRVHGGRGEWEPRKTSHKTEQFCVAPSILGLLDRGDSIGEQQVDCVGNTG